jgi:hypothetical protein
VSLLSVRLHAVILIPILLGFFCLSSVVPGYAEWYVGGYGGLSTGAKLTDVTMPVYGDRLAMDEFPTTKIPTTGDTVTQNFKTSNISLENSLIFGAKVTYFLDDPSWKWLGFELEAFSTKPDIKQQTLQTDQDITFTPGSLANCQAFTTDCPETRNLKGQLSVTEASLRVSTIAANVVARYPGTLLQPYAGIGVGAFYFNGSGQFDGRQVYPGLNALLGLRLLLTEDWGVFVESKYNLANVSNFDPNFGLSGTYSIFHFVTGLAYHF